MPLQHRPISIRVALSQAEYAAFEEWAHSEDRDVAQQARHLIRRALAEQPSATDAQGDATQAEPAAA